MSSFSAGLTGIREATLVVGFGMIDPARYANADVQVSSLGAENEWLESISERPVVHGRVHHVQSGSRPLSANFRILVFSQPAKNLLEVPSSLTYIKD